MAVFNTNQTKGLELLASGETPGNVGKTLNISKTAVQNWMKRKDFADALLNRKVELANGGKQQQISDAAPAHPNLCDTALIASKIEDLESLSVQYMELVLRSSIFHKKPNPTAFKIAVEALKRTGKIGAVPKPPESRTDKFSFKIMEVK